MSTTAENDPLRQLAESTETSAVREAFDRHNAKFGRALAVALGAFSAIALIPYLHAGLMLKAAGAAIILAASVAAFLASTGRMRRAAGFVSEWLAVLFVGQFAGLVVVSYLRPQDVSVFATITPWLAGAMWMPFARRAAVHAFIILIVILALETTPGQRRMGRAEYYIPAISSSAVALFVGGWISRRARRKAVGEWSERHAQAVEQLRMRDELQFAREVQLSMLPDAPPAVGWLDIAARSIPATEVGGDYYDYFRVGERVALVCGDVAGHGLASGIVLATLRSGFTLLRDALADPAAVLTRLHDLVERTSRRRMLATAAVVVLDPQSRRARIASAGHPPVMVRSNGRVRTIELFGPPLGVRLPITIAQTELPLSPGDVFVLHSDGVYETVNEAGELYGLDRLAALIAARSGTADDVLRAILNDIGAFRGNATQEDDVTVVVAVASGM